MPSDVPPPTPETEPEVPPPHRPIPDVPLTEPRPNEPPTRILPGDPEPAPETEPSQIVHSSPRGNEKVSPRSTWWMRVVRPLRSNATRKSDSGDLNTV